MKKNILIFPCGNEIRLVTKGIYPRRYFYPSLNTLPYIKSSEDCPVSEDISRRILCLPLFNTLSTEIIEKICDITRTSLII